MTTLGSILDGAVKALQQHDLVYGHGTAAPFDEAAFIVLEMMGLAPDTDLESFWDHPLTAPQVEAIEKLIKARIDTRKPAPYLLNKAYLRGLPFYVDERVLVPRSFIAELLMDDSGFAPPGMPKRVKRVLDLCTGSGCLAIVAAYQFEEAEIVGADISPGALEVARKNVDLHGLEDCVTLVESDVFSALKGQKFDLIITNPPYVDAAGMAALPAEYRHEPALALAAGDDGLDLVHKILEQAPNHLTPGGALLCEIGRCQPQLAQAYPKLPFLWLDTEESEGEVFWITRSQLES